MRLPCHWLTDYSTTRVCGSAEQRGASEGCGVVVLCLGTAASPFPSFVLPAPNHRPMKCFLSSRLETRAKESNAGASV